MRKLELGVLEIVVVSELKDEVNCRLTDDIWKNDVVVYWKLF